MPAPEENVTEVLEYLLRRNNALYAMAFSLGTEDAVYLVGGSRRPRGRRGARSHRRLVAALRRRPLPDGHDPRAALLYHRRPGADQEAGRRHGRRVSLGPCQ